MDEGANRDVFGYETVGSENRDMFFRMMNEWFIQFMQNNPMAPWPPALPVPPNVPTRPQDVNKYCLIVLLLIKYVCEELRSFLDYALMIWLKWSIG